MTQLDGVRALAILSVAWGHWAPKELLFGLPWGTGVQLFFVLSGFLITGILLDNKGGENRSQIFKSFYARRALRILPIFYATILVALVFNIDDIRSWWAWHVFYASNFFNVFVSYEHHFAHFWSLGVEEQFYIVWPLVVIFTPLSHLKSMIIALIVLAPVSRILLHFTMDHEVVRFLPTSSFDALGIGALLAYTLRHSDEKTLRVLKNLCLSVGLPLFALGGLWQYIDAPYFLFSLSHTGMVFFFGWLVLAAASGESKLMGLVLENPVMVYIGKISYGLYVIHNFSPIITNNLLSLLPELSFFVTTFVSLLLNTVITAVIAILSFHLFENPINQNKVRFPYQKK